VKCATLADQATDNDALLQSVLGHPQTHPPGVYVCRATSSHTRPCYKQSWRFLGESEGYGRRRDFWDMDQHV